MESGKMRTEQEMMDLILGVANSDERIRGVMLAGSRHWLYPLRNILDFHTTKTKKMGCGNI